MNYQAIAEWSQVASSLLFLGALVWLWIRYIQPAVLAAQVAQNARIAEAERHRDEAKAALKGLQREIEAAQRDALAIKERVTALMSGERETLLREAREAGERALRDAQAELPRARAAARAQLRDELIEKALAGARDIALRRVDAGANRKLVGSFVGSLARRSA
jgi:F0F1-type ATP synthase membrane subunit b/b'